MRPKDIFPLILPFFLPKGNDLSSLQGCGPRYFVTGNPVFSVLSSRSPGSQSGQCVRPIDAIEDHTWADAGADGGVDVALEDPLSHGSAIGSREIIVSLCGGRHCTLRSSPRV